MSNDAIIYPGKHLLIDCWECCHYSDVDVIEKTLQDAAEACGAKVLEVSLHSFGENSGVTGVAILAESHITIHTWPEINYIALDVFMCGSCEPEDSVEVFKRIFTPKKMDVQTIHRGKM